MSDRILRQHLIELICGGKAHIPFHEAVASFPVSMAGVRPQHSPHSAWELLEHMRIALRDMISFSGVLDEGPANPGAKTIPESYQELKWPDDYWPDSAAPPTDTAWTNSVTAIQEDIDRFAAYLADSSHDLYVPFPWGSGQNLLQEALQIADHNAYHLGQLVLLSRMLE